MPTARRKAARRPKAGRFVPASGVDAGGARKRIPRIQAALDRAYPKARTALHWRTPFELLVATILSAQCTDDTVNRATPALFRRFPDAAALARADLREVEGLVRSTGFFRQKAKAIVACARGLVDRFGGEVPRSVEALVTLPGAARKTANVVLSNCWPRPASDHGIFVDTHVRRVSQRLALTAEEDPERVEQELQRLVPASKWADFPHQLVLLGRGPCEARKPRHADCPLLRFCPTGLEASSAADDRPRVRRRR